MSASVAHNFFHQRDNWRMYIFDFTLQSSKNVRISHAISHHVFPNTIYDYDAALSEPFLVMLPKSSKNFVVRFGGLFYAYFIFAFSFHYDALSKVLYMLKQGRRPTWENFIPIVQLFLSVSINGSFLGGFW